MLEAFFIYTILQGNALVQPFLPPQDVRDVVVTAYSSTVDQCDADPFITASGKRVRDGIIATNDLPLGTKVILFNRTFVVEDRMNKKHKNKKPMRVDIWMDKTRKAIDFGIQKTEMIVL